MPAKSQNREADCVHVLEPGRVFDDFVIEDQIGVGGQGMVYLAWQVSLQRRVAIKVLGASSKEPRDLERFEREGVAVARLSHENIAKVFQIGQTRKLKYIVCEYIDGLTLREVLTTLLATSDAAASFDSIVFDTDAVRNGPELALSLEPTLKLCLSSPSDSDLNGGVPPAVTFTPHSPLLPPPIADAALRIVAGDTHINRSCDIAVRVARALDHAHERGVLHLDIKPENIMLGKRGEVRIIDFGLSRILGEGSRFFTSVMQGTPHYFAPEQLSPKLGVDHRADQFALGLVLYEMLTLKRAVQVEGVHEAMFVICHRDLPPLHMVNPHVPESIARIVHKATSKRPADRYDNMRGFADELENALADRPVLAPAYRARLHRREVIEMRPWHVGLAGSLHFGSSLFAGLLFLTCLAVAIGGNIEGAPARTLETLLTLAVLMGLNALMARAVLTGMSYAPRVAAMGVAGSVALAGIRLALESGVIAETFVIVLAGVLPTVIAAWSLSRATAQSWIAHLRQRRREYYGQTKAIEAPASMLYRAIHRIDGWLLSSKSLPVATPR